MLLASTVIDGDPIAAASAAALHHVGDEAPGLARLRRGKAFTYRDARGNVVRDDATLARIRALAIPPAWTDVWIAADAKAHIQATGRDARGRKQYRYHAKWRDVRDSAKYHRLVGFCSVLPRLRAAVARDLACRCLCKAKVVAAIVALMERAQLRVGNEEYARTNGSYGATTLRRRHARVRGATVELAYRGKSGVERRVQIVDRRLAGIVRQCHALRGARLFQYLDGDVVHAVSSNDVNAYLRDATNGPFTAKDYRTWAATLGAAWLLCGQERPTSERAKKRCVKQVIDSVAQQLGHTASVCRASYIHPRIIDDFGEARLAVLARTLARRVGAHPSEHSAPTIGVEILRAIEPVVAKYLHAAHAQRRRA